MVSCPFDDTACTSKCAVPCQATLSPLHGLTTVPETGSSKLAVDDVAGAARTEPVLRASRTAAVNGIAIRILPQPPLESAPTMPRPSQAFTDTSRARSLANCQLLASKLPNWAS